MILNSKFCEESVLIVYCYCTVDKWVRQQMMAIELNLLNQNYLPLLISCCSHSAGPQPTGQLPVH